MDWQTLVARRAKKDPPEAGGWSAFLTAWVAADVMNPVSAAYVNSGCDKASFGWPCDAEMEKLRDEFARSSDLAKQKEIAEAVQKRNIEFTAMIQVGEYIQPVAMRKNVKGYLTSPVPVLWNVEITK
jgi:peptide/nickel transport system substrate-binding protein